MDRRWGRGVVEVCSSLLTFFNVSTLGDESTKLVAWSDWCGGQNKNFPMMCFWQYIVLSRRFKSVEHKFPESGHSYLSCDRDFGKVESAVRHHHNIYSVDEYQSIMLHSVRNPQPTVTRMGDKFFDIHKMSELLHLVKRSVDTSGSKIELRDKVRWIKVTRFGWYQYKHSLTKEEPWKEVFCYGQTLKFRWLLHQLNCSHGRPWWSRRQNLINDITKQLRYIPTIYQGLYLSLKAGYADDVADQLQENSTEVLNIICFQVYIGKTPYALLMSVCPCICLSIRLSGPWLDSHARTDDDKPPTFLHANTSCWSIPQCAVRSQ